MCGEGLARKLLWLWVLRQGKTGEPASLAPQAMQAKVASCLHGRPRARGCVCVCVCVCEPGCVREHEDDLVTSSEVGKDVVSVSLTRLRTR